MYAHAGRRFEALFASVPRLFTRLSVGVLSFDLH
jgi:hypothetical protein